MIAVIAGTPIDTSMGVKFVEENGFKAIGYSISRTPEEQSLLQVVYPDKLYLMVLELITTLKSDGIETVFVYCNSLSAAVDMDKISNALKIRIITPLQIYVELGKEYHCLGVIAANNQSTYGIERAIQEKHRETQVIGTGMLKLVNAVERGLPPKELIEFYHLDELLNFYANVGCEAIILGCTHFSYFYEELNKISPLPLIDPTKSMLLKI
ncbi:MAG: aspartate/glutamate racemase family protein [Clostridiaceae bacterium]